MDVKLNIWLLSFIVQILFFLLYVLFVCRNAVEHNHFSQD